MRIRIVSQCFEEFICMKGMEGNYLTRIKVIISDSMLLAKNLMSIYLVNCA